MCAAARLLRTTAVHDSVGDGGDRWLIERQVGPSVEAAFYRSAADSEFIVKSLESEDWRRIAELTEEYADNGLGGVDASVIAVAERIGIATLATLDQRHFRVVRPRHVDAFTIVP